MNNPLISLAIIVISASFAFLYVLPEYTLFKTRSSDVTILDGVAKNSEAISVLVNETEKSLGKISPLDMTRFGIFLPETLDPVRFANNIQKMGFASGVVINSIKLEDYTGTNGSSHSATGSDRGVAGNVAGSALQSFDTVGTISRGATSGILAPKSNSEKKYSSMKASITFSSSYEKFQSFLYSMERSLGIVNILGLSMTPVSEVGDAKKNGAQTYQFIIDIESYALR